MWPWCGRREALGSGGWLVAGGEWRVAAGVAAAAGGGRGGGCRGGRGCRGCRRRVAAAGVAAALRVAGSG